VPVDPESSSSGTDTNPRSSSHLPILVNIGDLLSYWTNGLLRSTMHRVIFPVASNGSTPPERYSIAYFCHPLDDAKLEAVPSSIVPTAAKGSPTKDTHGSESGNDAKRRVMTAKEHLMSRLEATYGGAT
jgi:isopenicillin N synthase-like dioxygenase